MIHSLPTIVHKRAKRLGRGVGSKAGAKSGRGTTRHQKSREKIPLHFEGGQNKITKKFPLLRGKGKNKSISVALRGVNVEKLNKLPSGTIVTMASLVQAGLATHGKPVKILGRGKITVALKVALPISKKAVEKIREAGGTLISV